MTTELITIPDFNGSAFRPPSTRRFKIVLSLGAGVQSSTLALMAERGLIPAPDCGIFADTEAEPQGVYRWLSYLESLLSFPVHHVGAGSLTDAALAILTNRKTGKPYYSNRIPAFVKTDKPKEGQVGRHCTRDFKIFPIQRKVLSLVKPEMVAWRRRHKAALTALRLHERAKKMARESGVKCVSVFPGGAWQECQDDPLVVQYIGISKDEWMRGKPSRVPWIRHVWPLLSLVPMTRKDCLEWMREQGFPEPPRSACIYCPYKSNAEWLRLKTEAPEEFEAAAEFEKNLQAMHADPRTHTPGKIKGIPFLHRQCVPLELADLSPTANSGQMSLFESECEGMCGN